MFCFARPMASKADGSVGPTWSDAFVEPFWGNANTFLNVEINARCAPFEFGAVLACLPKATEMRHFFSFCRSCQ